MRRSVYKSLLLSIVILLLFLSHFSCTTSNQPICGGSSSGAGGECPQISGFLSLSNNKPAAFATVILRPSDFLPETPSIPAKRLSSTADVETTYTDKNGFFFFDNIKENQYIIEGISEDGTKKVLITGIEIDADFIESRKYGSWIQIIEPNYSTTLCTTSTIQGIVYPSGDSIVGNVYIRGLETHATIKPDGSFILEDVPQGELRLILKGINSNNSDPLENEITISTDTPFVETSIQPPNSKPKILFPVADTIINIAQGVSYSLKVIVTGSPQLFYQWYKNDSFYSTTFDNTLIFSNTSLTDTGFYHCKITNNSGQIISGKVKLQVHPPVRIFYNGNGNTEGEVPLDTVIYAKGNQITASGNSGNLRNGLLTFIGWNTEADGSGLSYSVNAVIDVDTSDIHLFAQWQEAPAGMKLIPAAGKTFMMGSNKFIEEIPVHAVSFTQSFWMDSTEVTEKEFEDLMSATYSFPKDTFNIVPSPLHPATCCWYEAALYCNARTKSIGSSDTVYSYTAIEHDIFTITGLTNLTIDLSKNGYALPTEAQWEFACRAGVTLDFFWGKNYEPYPQSKIDTNEIMRYAVWHENREQVVAQRRPNNFDLYDMIGNVSEWCNDWFALYPNRTLVDYSGPLTGTSRVIRGGLYDDDIVLLRSQSRSLRTPGSSFDTGFRTCLPEK